MLLPELTHQSCMLTNVFLLLIIGIISDAAIDN